MSLYNLINKVNPATFYILPMLDKHPDEYPRFRDCFAGALENSNEKDYFGIPLKMTSDEEVISVYTRVGGKNRNDYGKEIQNLRATPTYVRDYDDDFDSTYAVFIFSVPEEWKNDFDKILNGKGNEISKDYINQLKKVFPKLTETFDKVFDAEKT